MDNLFDTDTEYQEVEEYAGECEHENVKVSAEGDMFCSDCGLTQLAY